MDFRRVLDDHHHLQLLFDRVRAIACAPEAALPAPRWRAMLAHETRCLARAVDRHFAVEEQGGYMADVVARRPAFGRQVAALARQHGEIHDELQRIADAIARGAAPGDARRELRAVVAALDAHEHAETELMQSAMLIDVGCGD